MGMSASQARMLSLTARLSDLELRAQEISNAKIRLSDQAAQASQDYSDALDKQTLKVYSGLTSSGTSSYVDATAYNLTTYGAISTTDKQRFIKNQAGQVITTNAIKNYYDATIASTITVDTIAFTVGAFFAQYPNASALGKDLQAVVPTMTDAQVQSFFDKALSDSEAIFTAKKGSAAGAQTTYDQNTFAEIILSGQPPATDGTSNDSNLKNSDWLQSQVNAGNIFLYEYDPTGGTSGTGDFTNVSWTSGDSSLSEITNNTQTAKAEAEYETNMASIQSKDKRFDTQLSNIDTEHTAVQTEIESVKKVIQKNIERGLKIFDA